MKTTIADVAKMAGVAKSTVSRYLNGGHVSKETGQKIDQVIKKTNYEPNTFAQSLKAKNTNLIGVIVPRLNSYTVSLTLKGIDEKLREAGYQMLISNTDQKIEREVESLYSFANQKVAGIILIATIITENHLKAIEKINIPILSMGQDHQQISSLVYGDEEAGYSMGKYVLECGHRKIIYMGVTEADIAVGVKRKQGFTKAFGKQQDCEITYYESGFLMKDAYLLFSEILKTNALKEVTLVVCATDNIALGVMKAIGQQGLEIPKDISVTGFGDYEIADIIGLTTVRYPHQESGKIIAQKIISLSEGKKDEDLTNQPCELIERESVKNLNS